VHPAHRPLQAGRTGHDLRRTALQRIEFQDFGDSGKQRVTSGRGLSVTV
jgi:hypothetical protein